MKCRLWQLYAARRSALRAGKKAKAAQIDALIVKRLKTVGGAS